MPSEHSPEVKFELGNVLFIDIVGYSKLLINEQSGQLETLKKIVRGTEQFRLAEAEGKLLRLPTGDGGALVFRTNPEAPVLCAVEISDELKKHPELRVRMGIHSGPVNEITDLNEQANIAGAGINIAQRVMDCGDAGHILLSKHVAEDLEQYSHWRPHLHDLGECEVKHGARLSVVNFYTDEIGNAQLPEKFKRGKHRRVKSMVSSAAPRTVRPMWIAVWLAAALLLVSAFWIFSHRVPVRSVGASAHPIAAKPTSAKSIAVLPFENLSGDPNNAYFTEGVQEEILTRLSKIADLKVISRTSTAHYASAPVDLREIASKLGVANILEGSVQKAGDSVRVNVQLIRAATDDHVWADTFDRKLIDIFRIETEIAKTIAETLQAKLTGAEERAISVRPTENSEAYQLYLRGRYFWNKRSGDNLKKAADYFQQAVAEDPTYALAYAGLADSYILEPVYGAGSPLECYPKAKAAAKKALEIDDDLAEAHASFAEVLWEYDFDFSQSLREFQRAIELNPNYSIAHHWYGNSPLLSLGRFDEAIAEMKRALELDPLSLIINADLGSTYYFARRYDEAIDQLRKTIEIDPGFYNAHWNLGLAFELKGDLAGAIAEYQRARSLSDDPFVLSLLGHAYAVSGKRAEALKILDQLMDTAKQRYVIPYSLAIVHLGLGNKDEALRWLEKDYQDRDAFTIAYIKVDPVLDPLRGDAAFEALVQKVLSKQ